MNPDLVAVCSGFDWDDANAVKIRRKHAIVPEECEEAFENAPLVFADDPRHSTRETRYRVIGQTNAGHILFMVFTIRDNLIRVISARRANRKERKEYHTP